MLNYLCENCGSLVSQESLKKVKESAKADGWYYICPHCGRVITSYDEVEYKKANQKDPNGYLELNKAIIKGAIYSWEQASKKLALNPRNEEKFKELLSVEAFFKTKEENVFLDKYEADGYLTKLKTNPYYRKFIYLYKIATLQDCIKKLESLSQFKLEIDTTKLISELDICVEQYEDKKEYINKKIQEYEKEINKCMLYKN